MKNKKEINAGIIIIGNEVLSGRTKDINTSTLSLWLNSLGVQVKEVRIIPDIEKDIIETINTFKNKFSYVFTTGGIGPTHDDITAESVSKEEIVGALAPLLGVDEEELQDLPTIGDAFKLISSKL